MADLDYKRKKYQVIAKQVDDMTKNPIQHFMNGTKTFTIGLFGCDFRCSWCVNSDISQPEDNEFKQAIEIEEYHSASEICDMAVENGCPSITFSFTEPTVWYEYALYVAEEAHRRGLKTVWKSNGFRTAKIIPKMIGLIDAANIDIKYFSDADYEKFCGKGIRLGPVLETIIGLREIGVHVEVSTILMPTMEQKELENIAKWIASQSIEIPWHINRFHTMYKAAEHGLEDDRPQFSSDEIIAMGHRAGLKHVYSFEKRPWNRER